MIFFAVQDINLITKVRMTHCLEHLEIKYLHIFAIDGFTILIEVLRMYR